VKRFEGAAEARDWIVKHVAQEQWGYLTILVAAKMLTEDEIDFSFGRERASRK
jgi:hypothetical protein